MPGATLAIQLSAQMKQPSTGRCRVRLYSQRDVNAVVKASKARLIFLLGLNEPGGFILKPMLIYPSEKPRAFGIYTKSILPILCKWNKAQMISCLLISRLAHFKPIIETY